MFEKLFNYFRKKEKPQDKFITFLTMVLTAPSDQASKEVIALVKNCLSKKPSEAECYDLLEEISKREDVSLFVVSLCDVSKCYKRPE